MRQEGEDDHLPIVTIEEPSAVTTKEITVCAAEFEKRLSIRIFRRCDVGLVLLPDIPNRLSGFQS